MFSSSLKFVIGCRIFIFCDIMNKISNKKLDDIITIIEENLDYDGFCPHG